MAIGDRVRELRDSKGLTQPKLAHMAGITERALRDLEKGETKNPSMATVKGLATALGVPQEDLLGDEPIERPAPKGRSAVAGHTSAREAVVDESHYLQFLFKRSGLVTEEQRLAAAAKLDERYRQFSTLTPALVDLWLEGYVRDLPAATSRKHGRGAAR
jgi:transcriptional regulator with XRE-family HTH domain